MGRRYRRKREEGKQMEAGKEEGRKEEEGVKRKWGNEPSFPSFTFFYLPLLFLSFLHCTFPFLSFPFSTVRLLSFPFHYLPFLSFISLSFSFLPSLYPSLPPFRFLYLCHCKKKTLLPPFKLTRCSASPESRQTCLCTSLCSSGSLRPRKAATGRARGELKFSYLF